MKIHNSLKIRLLICVIFLIHSVVKAQPPAWVSQFKDDSLVENKLISEIHESHGQSIKNYRGADYKYAEELYKEREALIVNLFKNNAVISDRELESYLTNLAAVVIASNPAIAKKKLRIYFSREFIPNATSFGDGTILFNIGLFSRLENEAQAAFVLGHELAHFMLGHSERSIEKYISGLYGDSVQQALKRIKSQEYNKSKDLQKLVNSQLFGFRKHSRENERQADSMAVEYLKATRFDLSAARTCLALLDTIDIDKYQLAIPLEKVLDFPEYPFRKKWLKPEENIFGSVKPDKDPVSDSLKTHPDCSKRISYIFSATPELKERKKFLVDSSMFISYQRKMEMEAAGYAYTSGNVSRALFYALNLSEKYPVDPYPRILAGQSLNALYEAMKNHQLRSISEMPGLRTESEYENFIVFLENLRIQELASLSYYYHKKYQNSIKGNEYFTVSIQRSVENYSKQNFQSK